MRALLYEIKKHLTLYVLFLKFSVMSQMEYRANFIGNLSMETGYLFVKLSYVAVIYRAKATINGLTPDQILLFSGTFVALTGLYAGLFMINNFGLRGKIKDGDLDLLLTKPVSLQFMATLRQADLTIFSVDVIAGVIMIIVAWARLSIPVTLVNVGGYVALFLISGVVSYSLFLMPQILSFWLMNTSAIAEITDSFWDFNCMPMDIYTRWIKFVGVFAIPIFVVTNFPPLFLLRKMPDVYYAWVLVLPLALLYVVHLMWRQGLRSYSSASS